MRKLWAATGVAALVASLLLTGPAALGATPSDAGTERGSIWMQRNDPDPATYYILNADGTLLTIDPYLGYGVGVWEPSGERSLSSVLVFADVDTTLATTTPGVATFRSEMTLDETSETASAESSWTLEPADGSTPTSGSGTLPAMTRLWLAPMPPEATMAAPPDPGWQPVLSPGAGGGGIGLEGDDPPNHNVLHPDGTMFSFNAWVGPGVGLGWPIDDTSALFTIWFTEWDPDDRPLVGEGIDYMDGTHSKSRYGTSAGYTDFGSSSYMRLETPDGTPLASPDPALWPERGSAWIERHADRAPGLMLVWADGTVLHIDPGLGTGLGLWQPTAEGTAPVAIRYNSSYPNGRYNTMPGVADLVGEMTIDDAAATLTTTYGVKYGGARKAGDPSGTMVADRIQLEPTVP